MDSQNQTITPEYLTIDDLTKYSSLSKTTLRKWLGLGMPYYKIGRCVRVKRSDFDAWLAKFKPASGANKLDDVWSEMFGEA